KSTAMRVRSPRVTQKSSTDTPRHSSPIIFSRHRPSRGITTWSLTSRAMGSQGAPSLSIRPSTAPGARPVVRRMRCRSIEPWSKWGRNQTEIVEIGPPIIDLKRHAMALTVTPEPCSWQNPDDESCRSRLRFRLWQLEIAGLTVFVTTWLCTIGPVAAIIALLIAKHVLVSMLVMRYDVDAGPRIEA